MKKDFIVAAFIILAFLALYSVNRATLGHSIPDEKRYIQSTKEMVASGDYITPHYHGKLRFQKPVLFYWLIVLSYKLFGVTIFGARFPSIIAGILNVIVTFLLGRRLFDKKTGIFSALVLATSEIFFMYSRFAVPDMAFALFVNMAIYAFAEAYFGNVKSGFRYIPMFVFTALAMLTKGPLGFLYPLLTITIFLAIRKERRIFRDMNVLLGIIIFLAISAPWFIAMILLHGKEYIGNVWSLEIVKKISFSPFGGENTILHYFSSIFYYLGMVFLRGLPWTVFLPAAVLAIPHYPRTTLGAGRSRSDYAGFHLILSWFFAVFTVITLIWSRESYYILPLSIPLAMFIGVYLSALTEKDNLAAKALFRLPFILIIVFSLCSLLGWLWFTVYALGEPIVSPSLFMFLPIAFMMRAYINPRTSPAGRDGAGLRRKKRILLPVSLFVASAAFFAYLGGYIISIVDDEPLILFADGIKAVIKDGDLIAASSSGASYHRLNVYLDEYEVVNIRRLPKEAALVAKEDVPLNEFLSTKNVRVFCVMSKNDYDKFVKDDLKKKLYIMDKAFKWKRFEKEDAGYFKKMLSYILHNERGLFRESLKDEIYLVSNMP